MYLCLHELCRPMDTACVNSSSSSKASLSIPRSLCQDLAGSNAAIVAAAEASMNVRYLNICCFCCCMNGAVTLSSSSLCGHISLLTKDLTISEPQNPTCSSEIYLDPRVLKNLNVKCWHVANWSLIWLLKNYRFDTYLEKTAWTPKYYKNQLFIQQSMLWHATLCSLS